MKTRNPKSLKEYGWSFERIWNEVKRKGLQDSKEDFYIEVKKSDGQELCIILTFVFDIDFIKARVFDEVTRLPYKMDEDIIGQAFSASNHLKYMGMNKLSEWLETIAENNYKYRFNI